MSFDDVTAFLCTVAAIAFLVFIVPLLYIIGYKFNNGSGRSEEELNWKSFFKWLLGKCLKKVSESEKKEDK